jgi:hypothetical protein
LPHCRVVATWGFGTACLQVPWPLVRALVTVQAPYPVAPSDGGTFEAAADAAPAMLERFGSKSAHLSMPLGRVPRSLRPGRLDDLTGAGRSSPPSGAVPVAGHLLADEAEARQWLETQAPAGNPRRGAASPSWPWAKITRPRPHGGEGGDRRVSEFGSRTTAKSRSEVPPRRPSGPADTGRCARRSETPYLQERCQLTGYPWSRANSSLASTDRASASSSRPNARNGRTIRSKVLATCLR